MPLQISTPMETIHIVIIVVLVLLIALYVCRSQKEGFVSQQARQVYSQSRELFEKNGGTPRYSEYKSVVPNADAVLYDDVKKLWSRGKLSPEAVQAVI